MRILAVAFEQLVGKPLIHWSALNYRKVSDWVQSLTTETVGHLMDVTRYHHQSLLALDFVKL